MKAKQTIFIYSDSIILGAVAASLRRTSQFEVMTLPSLPLLAKKFDILTPDILIFDLENPNTEVLFSLLEAYPTLQLIGISPDINLVKIWSGRELRDISTQGLLELITDKIYKLSKESTGDGDSPLLNFDEQGMQKESGQFPTT
jgi:hypothetical protein